MIVDIDFQGTTLTVQKNSSNLYDVKVGDEIKHPNLGAEDVMRTLGHYLHNTNYQLAKLTQAF